MPIQAWMMTVDIAFHAQCQTVGASDLASMLLAQALIDQGLNFLTYAGTSALDAVTVDQEELDDLSVPDERE
ncbi:MAG: hypothetical protein ABEL51_12520 [Salinibacter sp.]